MAEHRSRHIPHVAVDRRAFLRLLGLGSAGGLLAACQQSAPTSQQPAAAAAPAEPRQAAPARPEWEAEWNRLVEAARAEGTVVVSGPPTAEVRSQLTTGFKQRFGIDLEYLGGRSGDLMTRILAERAADRYTLDAMIGGATTMYYQAYPAQMLDPLPPILIHPEVTDPTRWVRGAPWYMDPEQQYILRLANQSAMIVTVNTDQVHVDEIQSFQSLLDPRFRGKISAYDPGVSGPGSANAAYLLHLFGEDYVRRLYQDQQPAISREDRQLGDWLARGTYPINFGLMTAEVEPLRRDGFPIAVALADVGGAPRQVSAGFGLAVLVNRAPHPNAARLFLNWIAMREGNEIYNRAQVSVSTRTDVDNSWAPAYLVPKPGEEYVDVYEWEWMNVTRTPEHLERLKRLTGR